MGRGSRGLGALEPVVRAGRATDDESAEALRHGGGLRETDRPAPVLADERDVGEVEVGDRRREGLDVPASTISTTSSGASPWRKWLAPSMTSGRSSARGLALRSRRSSRGREFRASRWRTSPNVRAGGFRRWPQRPVRSRWRRVRAGEQCDTRRAAAGLPTTEDPRDFRLCRACDAPATVGSMLPAELVGTRIPYRRRCAPWLRRAIR